MMSKKNLAFADYYDSLSKAQYKLKKTKKSLIILKDGKYYGMLDAKHIRETRVKDPSNTHCGSIASKAPKLYENTTLIETAKAFFSSRLSRLAILNKHDMVIGELTRFEILNLILKEKVISKIRVEEIMSYPAITINEELTVNHATTLMREKGVRRVIAVNNEGKMKGILSVHDIGINLIQPTERIPRIKFEKVSPWEQPLKPLIKTKVETIAPNKTVNEAIKKMIDKNIASLVVCENKNPIGLISAKDIFETIIKLKPDDVSVHISGLDVYDKPFYDEIENESKRVLTKIHKKDAAMKNIFLHIKKYGNRYTVIARLEIGNKVLTAKGNEWNLLSAVNEALENLSRLSDKRNRKNN